MNASTDEILPRSPSDRFDTQEWLRLTEALRRHEAGLRRFAQMHRLELRSNSRWPELRLRRSSLFSIGEARVSMRTEPVYPQTGSSHPGWVVRSVRYPRPWLAALSRQSGESREVARIADTELRRSEVELLAALELAIRALG